ncbi:MAG: FAD-dependent oxidoreductase [Clostridia bacterium]|nr:FAD-dependent oxidoreductase [Clostridia bacterium]
MVKYDLIVVGGGISGVAAAVSAAREGMKVLLIEKFGSLGGAMSNSLVFPFMGFTCGDKLLSDGIFTEMRNRKDAYGGTGYEEYKLVFDDMVSEAGVDVIFHSNAFEAVCEGRIIKSLKVATKSGVMEFEADFFIDASGDGELIAMTGCDIQLGREEDGLCQPMTTCFRLCNVDYEIFKRDRAMIQEKYKEYREAGKIKNPRENILIFPNFAPGVIHFNTTRVIKHNPVDPFEVSRAEMIARKQIYEMVSFLKEVSKAFENCVLVSSADHIGVRESRKLKGVHILTEQELKDCVKFDDCIALGNYDIDIHNPSGTGTLIYHIEEGKYYQIPYRSLLPKEYDNMLVCGRCLSATHVAHSAVRIMPICACMGEAAGVALAYAKKTDANAHTVDIQAVRQILREKNAAVD